MGSELTALEHGDRPPAERQVDDAAAQPKKAALQAAGDAAVAKIGATPAAAAQTLSPTDERVAEMNLSSRLNQYLFAVRNLHMLVQRQQLARPQFEQYASEYTGSLKAFRDWCALYEATLSSKWPEPVRAQWQALSALVNSIHEQFWTPIAASASTITDKQKVPSEVQAQVRTLEPALVKLEKDIAAFMRSLVDAGRM